MKWEELDENKQLGLTLRSPSILEYGDDATADDLLFSRKEKWAKTNSKRQHDHKKPFLSTHLTVESISLS